MRLVDLNSDRACIIDIENDGFKELIYTRLSNIIIVDSIRGKVKRQIKIKPRAIKQRAEFDQETYKSISTEDQIYLQGEPSAAGEVILKLHVKDVDNDGKPEITLLRVDGILACYDVNGHEKWSFFLEPHVADLVTSDRGAFRVLTVSKYGFLYAISTDGKLYKVDLQELPGSPTALASVDPDAGLYAILTREGTIYLIRIEFAKEILRRTVKVSRVASLDLPKQAESSSMCTVDLYEDGIKKVLIAGMSDGAVLVIDPKDMEIKARVKLPDRISRIFELPMAKTSVGVALDWLGNLALIRGCNKIEIHEASPRRKLIDLDNDNSPEEIAIFAKNLRIKKCGELVNEIQGESYISSYVVDDINIDGKKEVVVAWNSRTIAIYDHLGRVLDTAKTLTIPRALLLLDVDDDNKKEIIVFSNDSVEVFHVD